MLLPILIPVLAGAITVFCLIVISACVFSVNLQPRRARR